MTITTINHDDFTKTLADMEQTQAMCEKLLQTKHYQKMGPEGVYALVAKAKAIGISPLDALNGSLYYVQGKVGMSTEMMASLIRQAGHSIVKDQKSDNQVCVLHGKRKDNGDTWTCIFSMEDARRAGLAKNMYEKYPSIMLYNRCMSMLARQLFPDVIKGAGYTMDELKEIAESKKVQEPVEMTFVPVEKKEPEVKKPSPEQVLQLCEILEQCDPKFRHEKLETITKLGETLNTMNMIWYERLLKLALENKAERTRRIMEGENVESTDDQERDN